MDFQQRQSMKMVFVLLASSVFCGIATFIAIALVMDRSDAPVPSPTSSTVVVMVAGTPIALYPDPNKVVVMAKEMGSGIAPETAATISVSPGLQPDLQPTALASPIPPTAIPLPTEVILVGYVVQPGDSLYRITQKQNTSIDLMALYGISSENILVGNTLSLPVANPAFCPGSIPYVVRDHETVSSIAQYYGTSADAIAAMNNLDANYTIKTTQVICIP